MRIKCLFMAVLGVILLGTGVSAPLAQQSSRAGLDTRGFAESRIYQRIYYGYFKALQSEQGFARIRFQYVYEEADDVEKMKKLAIRFPGS